MNKVRIGSTDFYVWRKIRKVNGDEVIKVEGRDRLVKRDDMNNPYIDWSYQTPPDGAITDRIIIV